jgi:hypothetical protein
MVAGFTTTGSYELLAVVPRLLQQFYSIASTPHIA